MQKKNPQDLLKIIQTQKKGGLIEQVPSILDYMQGLETGIAYEVLNPTANWYDYLPAPEKQYNKKGDYLACTSFSHLNVRETRFNYKLKNNLFPEHVVKFLTEKGYIGDDGKVNFSDRFIAKLARTNVIPPGPGASLPTVGETVRLCGVIPEKLWPTTENMTWDEYYAEIPAELIALGKESLKYFKFLWEWVDANAALIDEPLTEDTIKALKQSPLQISIPVPGFHATMLYSAEILIPDGEKVAIFDTYEPFFFGGDKTYPIHYSMKLVEVVVAPEVKPIKPSYTFSRNLKYGMSGPDVNMLQKVLQYEGDFKHIPTEYFGPRTKEALQKYQKRNGIPATGNFWDITRTHINEKYGLKKKALE